MDPFSITTGVLGLMGMCYRVGTVLKDYIAAVEIVDEKINGLQATVESFIQVLTLMENTLKQDEIKTSLRATGHISNHWHHLSASIRDGQEILFQLRDLLETVNRNASVLSGPRKHQRLQDAAEEIAAYQYQIQGYRDTLQLSLQTVTLSKQVTLQESTDKILPKLEEVEQEVRRMAFTITRRMTGLQSVIESRTGDSQLRDRSQPETPKQLQILENLMDCVQSAATIVSDASTTLGIDQGRGGSDFGDCFPPQRNETMLRWIEDNTIREEHPDPDHSTHQRRESTSRSFGPVSRDIDDSDSESETDLEEEIIHSLIAKGKQALENQKFKDAESHFFNGLNRTRGSRVPSNRISESKSELIQLLLQTYRTQDKLVDAKSLLMDSIHMDPFNLGLLSDLRLVGEALFQNKDYLNAFTCGRRALKSYLKLGSAAEKEKTLHMLIQVCKAQGNHDDQLGFEAMLSHPQSHAGSRRDSLVSAMRSPRLDDQASTPARRLSYGKAPDLGDETRPIRVQSPKCNSLDLLGPIGEGEFVQWGELPSPMVSNTTTGASSSGLISEGQVSTWSPNSMTTPESVHTALSNNGGKGEIGSESNTPKIPSSGSTSDVKSLLLRPKSGYFDSKPQPRNFPTGRHVQSGSSTSSVLGEPANIDRFEKDITSCSNASGLREQTHSTATTLRLPITKGSETTSDSSWLDKESEKEMPPHKRTRQKTIPNLPSQTVSHIKLNITTPKKADIYKKIVVVGDSKCGKTPLLSLIAGKHCPEDPPPTQWDLYTFEVELDGKHIELAMWELGAHDKEGLSRLLSSPKPDAFLVCFSIDCDDSLSQVKKRWVKDVQKFSKKAPYILVGLKCDIRSDSRTIEDLERKGQRLTTTKEGHDVAELIEAEKYLECSAKTGEGVSEVLETATRLTLQDRKKKKKEDKKKDDGKREKGSEDKKSFGIRNLFKGKT